MASSARRPRYSGKNPRRFEEKYKELAPEKHPDEIAKVLASGKTPAGSHVPVLVAEVLACLSPKPGEIAVDATLGYGGHAAALLPRLLPGGLLLALDVDPVELPRAEARVRVLAEAAGAPDAFRAFRSNFAGLLKILAKEGRTGVDLVLADLGVSSMQLDDPRRGFTFKHEGPLDLRMNPARGAPAERLLARISERDLVALLVDVSDEPHAAAISRAIVTARSHVAITTTTALAAAVRSAMAEKPARVRTEEGDAPIRRTFQALRVLVNEELSALDAFLDALPSCLSPGGRVAIISFHSGEDRRVKKAFRAGMASGVYSTVAPDVLRATESERRANPRAAPAKLRWAVRASR